MAIDFVYSLLMHHEDAMKMVVKELKIFSTSFDMNSNQFEAQ